ncbi:tetraspanin, putative [Medicago truncatula]|uniref:Tetraspanin, putative n=1 Tax=Medicago truncatula TaxID=3880 RepID=A0A072TV33_MEDTR|nr:tetraspanin, putative [Medicago truncatula]
MADKLQIKEVNFCLFMMTMMHKVCRERGMLHAWLNNSHNLKQLRVCLVKTEDCNNISKRYETPKQYKLAKLTPTEAGCCQPPSECGYPAVNASYYDLTFHPVSPNHDCKRYKNSQNAIIVTCK